MGARPFSERDAVSRGRIFSAALPRPRAVSIGARAVAGSREGRVQMRPLKERATTDLVAVSARRSRS